MKGNFFCLFVLSLALLASCKKSECADREKGTLKNYTGLDGCAWIIELDNGQKLEPLNLDEFIASPADGMKVRVNYIDDIEMASICMVGKIARINCLEKLK